MAWKSDEVTRIPPRALKTDQQKGQEGFPTSFTRWPDPTYSLTRRLVEALAKFPVSYSRALGMWSEANSFLNPVHGITLPLEPCDPHTSHVPQQAPCFSHYSSVLSGDSVHVGMTFLLCSSAMLSLPVRPCKEGLSREI